MKWKDLTFIDQISNLIEESKAENISAVLVFKHSTRCSISFFAKKNFEAEWDKLPYNICLYYLDLISHRDVSNDLAERFSVRHESPQVLLIKNGECIYHASHHQINIGSILENL